MDLQLEKILNMKWQGNTMLDWAFALGFVLVTLMVLWVVKAVALRRLGDLTMRLKLNSGAVFLDALQKTQPLVLFLIALWMGAQQLELPKKTDHLIDRLTLAAMLVQLGLWAMRLLDGWMKSYRERRLATNPDAVTSFSAFSILLKLAAWICIALLILENFGVDVTALMAGLGIGGVAVALAAQNILGDLFASLSIAVDRPFVVGDFLVLGEYMGTVEYIGMKNTRLRSLSGEQIVMSNTNLLGSRIRNYGRMYERRVATSISVTYQTTREQLKAIPDLLRSIIEKQTLTRFDRAHLKSFGDSGIEIEYVYYVVSADYNTYMDINQRINLAMLESFEAQGIEFAYPTRTVMVRKLEDSFADAGAT